MTAHKNYACPCCGAVLEAPIGIDGTRVWLGANQQALFNIVKKHPAGISADVIRQRLFSRSRNGEPYAHCDSIVAATANYTNKKIKAWGLKIVSTKGPGSVYRLVRL